MANIGERARQLREETGNGLQWCVAEIKRRDRLVLLTQLRDTTLPLCGAEAVLRGLITLLIEETKEDQSHGRGFARRGDSCSSSAFANMRLS